LDSKGNIQTGVEKFVDFKIFYFAISLLIISTGVAFAQESIIEVQTDDNNYDEGDTISYNGCRKHPSHATAFLRRESDRHRSN